MVHLIPPLLILIFCAASSIHCCATDKLAHEFNVQDDIPGGRITPTAAPTIDGLIAQMSDNIQRMKEAQQTIEFTATIKAEPTNYAFNTSTTPIGVPPDDNRNLQKQLRSSAGMPNAICITLSEEQLQKQQCDIASNQEKLNKRLVDCIQLVKATPQKTVGHADLLAFLETHESFFKDSHWSIRGYKDLWGLLQSYAHIPASKH